jgi:lipoprotein-anchoring transpeptidase ErfK/SrfK
LTEPAPSALAAGAESPPTPSPAPDDSTPSAEPAAAPEPLPPPLTAPVTAMDYAVWQVRMERENFSCGTIDGNFGMRSKRSIVQYQKARGLPVTGTLDLETRLALGAPERPFMLYTVSAADLAQIAPPPTAWRDKAKAGFLGYKNGWEMLAGKFHSSAAFIRQLNPGLASLSAGVIVTVPNLEPSVPVTRASKITIILSETTMLLYDRHGRLQACFPCSIAADKNKRPNGQLTVVTGALNPNYTFNPEVLKTAAEREGITSKLMIPPGPNNPVGLAWVSLSLPGYGIHGTPDPMEISRSGSHGCFRLANWNAIKVLNAVTRGTPVEVIE